MKNKLKNYIKKRPFLLNKIKPVYKWLINIPRKLGWYKAPRMLEGELNFFRHIYKQLKVIVDVGARYDTDYIEISEKNSICYYFFEVNPMFYRKLKKNLIKFKEEMYVENFAVGERNGSTEYYEDSESLLQSTTGVKNSTMKLKKKVRMIRLDAYLKKSITIDFLKTDIEEYDYFALIGCGELLNKCKFVQFELGLGAPIGDKFVSYEHYYELFAENFSLYILKDENNPLWVKGLVDCDLIILDDLAKAVIRNAENTGVGFNIIAVNNKYETNISGLHIRNLDQSHLKENIFVYDLD